MTASRCLCFLLWFVYCHSVSLVTESPPPKQKTTQQFLLSSQALKILTNAPRQTKSLDNSNTLNMFNKNTYANFKTAYTHMLILRWCHAGELFGSQIPMTTGGFELRISCIQSSYLTHEVIRSNRPADSEYQNERDSQFKPSCVHWKLWIK